MYTYLLCTRPPHNPPHLPTHLPPGTDISDVLVALGVAAESQLVSPEHLMKLYQDHMAVVEQKCVDNLKELLLERSDLFTQAESANILERVDLGLTVRGGGCEGVNDCVMLGGL